MALGSYGSDELLCWLVAKYPRDRWDECRAREERKARTLTYEDLSVPVLEPALVNDSDQNLNAYRPGGGNSRNNGRGYQGPRPRQGSTPKSACYMSNVQDLLWCDARDEKGGLSASWSRAKSRRPTLPGRPGISTTTDVPSPCLLWHAQGLRGLVLPQAALVSQAEGQGPEWRSRRQRNR